MKKLLFLLFATVAAAVNLVAQPTARVVQGPYIQALTESQFTVVWTTSVDAVSWVEVAPDDGTHFYAYTRPRYYHSEYGKRLMGRLHKVTVSGLCSGTKYRYRIFQQPVIANEGNKRVVLGDGSGSDILKRKPYCVKTLDNAKSSFLFSMVCDIHSDDSLFRALVGDVAKRGDDFVVFNGDMQSHMESDSAMYAGYLSSAVKMFASDIPFFAVRGNHEYRGRFSYRFMDQFPTTTSQPYYTVRHGAACIVVLDSGEDKPDSDVRYYGLSTSDEFRQTEAQWLRGVVASEEFTSAPIKIVVIHMPPTSNGWHGVKEVHRLFVPILNEAKIDLMLCGHYHRHSFLERGTDGCDFPVLINSNKHRATFRVDAQGIDVDVVDAKGSVVHQYKLGKR